jgi:hypothetical protein
MLTIAARDKAVEQIFDVLNRLAPATAVSLKCINATTAKRKELGQASVKEAHLGGRAGFAADGPFAPALQ